MQILPVIMLTHHAHLLSYHFAEDVRTKFIAHDRTIGLHDVRLSEIDLRLQCAETANYEGVLIWKIGEYRQRKLQAVGGRILSLYSQPFYTSRYGYKMCARIYLNGDGVGRGTHLSLFFVVMQVGSHCTVLISVDLSYRWRRNEIEFHVFCLYAGVKWVGMRGNTVPSPAISAIWRSQASKSTFFSVERMFPGRKDSFIHWNATSESEIGQDDGLPRNTGASCKFEGVHRFIQGTRGFLPFPLPENYAVTPVGTY